MKKDLQIELLRSNSRLESLIILLSIVYIRRRSWLRKVLSMKTLCNELSKLVRMILASTYVLHYLPAT